MPKRGRTHYFMMTYGWAIVIVLVAVLGLHYFGTAKGDSSSDTCTIAPGITCVSQKATPQSTTLIIQNNLGQEISATQISAAGCEYSITTPMKDRETTTFTLNGCSNGAVGDKLKGDLILTYSDQQGVNHVQTGELITNVG